MEKGVTGQADGSRRLFGSTAMRYVQIQEIVAVPILPTALVKPAKIATAVKRAERALRPDVVRIRYNLGEDWTGAPSLYYRVLLTDKASKPGGLHEISERVGRIIRKEVKAEDMGLNEYFFFRSFSEQAEMKEASWE